MFEREYRDLSFVPRWSIIRQIKSQSVADHSFYVALYAEQLSRLICWDGDRYELLKYALYHDADECYTGDMVGPVKRAIYDREKYENFTYKHSKERFPDVFPLEANNEIKAIIKIADGIDEMMYLAGEIQMGNHSIDQRFVQVQTRYKHLTMKLLKEALHLSDDRTELIWGKINYAVRCNLEASSRVYNDLELK